MMIPKIIHYCWVGGNPKPESVLRCIESWKKYCPDYEIREWNESNYDFKKNKYMAQAYEEKKWGFVPDYARLDIVYEYGGIYVDTDVEFIRSMDSLLNTEAFMGFENTGFGETFVNCGHGFGAVRHHEIIKKLRDAYDHLDFYQEDGSLNLTASPYYTTMTLLECGLVRKNEDQVLDKMMIYASDVLCPKNFRTGKIHKTKRTISIHHFTASWLDDEIKARHLHTQKVYKYFGKRLGYYVLICESVFEKYSVGELIKVLPSKASEKAKKRIVPAAESFSYYKELMKAKLQNEGSDSLILLDTYLESDNLGDQIIMESCVRQLEDIMNLADIRHIPTHRFLRADEKNELKKSKVKLLCGTNILSGHMKSYGLWKLGKDISPYKNTILMGVGFDKSDDSYDRYTKELFKTILSQKYLHSVRDSYAEQKLNKMGVFNVINTGCPTMWGITEKLCEGIPTEKGNNVVCTLTDYCQDETSDTELIEILCNIYNKVYFWPQGQKDFEYITRLGLIQKVEVLQPLLEDFDRVLQMNGIDYIGTRLHAGIRAITFGKRSIVIAIDDRSRWISKDTGLTILERSDIHSELREKAESSFKTQIHIPVAKIELWKSQF